MKKGFLLALAIGFGLTANAQLHTPEIKVQGTETRVYGSNGSSTYLGGNIIYVFPGDGSHTAIGGSAVNINRNNSICGAMLTFQRQGSTDWSIKNSMDNCGVPGGLHFLNAGRVTRVSFLQNGNVGVGYHNPSYKLQVYGQIASYGTVLTSDERLKHDIKDYASGLALVKQVKVKKYKYLPPKDDFQPRQSEDIYYDQEPKKATTKSKQDAFYQQDQIGVLAQELKLIAPDLVGSYTDDEGNEIFTINHSALTFILINAVKELNAQVEELQKQLNEK